MLFKNGRVLIKGKWQVKDFSVHDGQFADKDQSSESVDLKGQMVFPGLIDVHVHLRDGRLSYKETYESGADAALAGGITTCLVMANGDPPLDCVENVRVFRQKTHHLPLRLMPIGAVTKGLEGKVLVDFQRMKDEGCVAFSDDGSTLMDSRVLLDALRWSESLGFVVILHEEDRCLSRSTGVNPSLEALKRGFPMSSEVAEFSLLARDLELLRSEVPKAHVHIAHVSSLRSLEMIQQARHGGLNVSSEVTPHHLYFNDSEISRQLGFAKMSPPLRSAKTQEGLWRALVEGQIDMIATDHAPHSPSEKRQTLASCPCGVVGVETAVSALWTLCRSDEGVFAKVLKNFTEAPAHRFGLQGGSMESGRPADFVVFDPSLSWTVKGSRLRTQAKHTPWEGIELKGRVRQTWVGGRKVYDDQR